MTLKDDLTDIRGIGEARADAIIDLFAEAASGPAADDAAIDAAIDAAERGNEGEVIAFLESLRD